MSVEYPHFGDKERRAAFSAAKKLGALPEYRQSAGEFVFAANLLGHPPLLTDSLYKPSEQTIMPVQRETTSPEPKLSPPELRVINKALPALVADGRLTVADGRMYSDLVQKRLGANMWEFTRTNRRFFLGSAAGLGIGTTVAISGIGLSISGIRGNQHIHQEVGNYINSLYQSDPRNLHGRPATSSQALKADKDMRDERDRLTDDQLQHRGLENGREKIGAGFLFTLIAGLSTAAGIAVFIDNLKKKIRWWKEYPV